MTFRILPNGLTRLTITHIEESRDETGSSRDDMWGEDSAKQAEEGGAWFAATLSVCFMLPSEAADASGNTSHWFASDIDAEHQEGKVEHSLGKYLQRVVPATVLPSAYREVQSSCPF